jgi:hypothetical protein
LIHPPRGTSSFCLTQIRRHRRMGWSNAYESRVRAYG